MGNRRTFIVLLILVYLIAVYSVYKGPLSGLLPTAYPVLRDLIWNYSVLALSALALWSLSRFLPKREIPRLPATPKRFWVFLLSVMITAFFLVSFWKWIIVSPPSSLVADLGNWLLQYVSKSAANRVLNAILALYATIFVLVIVIWQLRGWRRQTFTFSWKDGIGTAVLLAIATLVNLTGHHLFDRNGPVVATVPSGGILNAVIMFASQSLVNGLPEELYYRGYIFPQLLAWLRHPLTAGWVMVILFNASHIPSFFIGHGIVLAWWKWILWCTFNLQPTGWLFFLIYFRMRSVIPGVIYHTYTTLWAFPFLL